MADPMRPERKRSVDVTPRMVIAGILVVALVILSAANTDETNVDLLFKDYDLPLVVLIVIVGIIGFAIGYLVGRRRDDD